MMTTVPDFMEWVIVDIDGWHLKPDAPDDVVKKFNAYLKEIEDALFPDVNG